MERFELFGEFAAQLSEFLRRVFDRGIGRINGRMVTVGILGRRKQKNGGGVSPSGCPLMARQ